MCATDRSTPNVDRLGLIRIGGATKQPPKRVVAVQRRIVVGQAVRVTAVLRGQVHRECRQRAPHGIDIGGDRRSGLHNLRGLEPGRAVEIAERIDPGNRAEVDQRHLLLGEHDVLRLQVVVDQADRMQITERGKDFQQVGDRLGDGQLRGLPVVDALLERLPADVFHDDVADRVSLPVDVLDEIEDLHDLRVNHFGEELAFGHRDRLGLGVAGVDQALEHHRTVVDVVIDRQVDPAQPAVGDAALDFVLSGDGFPGIQLRHEGITAAAGRAPALRRVPRSAPR